MEVKKEGKKYRIELDFDELDVIYHALGLYKEELNDILARQWGVRLTGGEYAYLAKAKELTKTMRECEPDLYYCFAFEGEGLPSALEEQ